MNQFNLIFFNKVLMSPINSARDPLKKKKTRPTVHILKKKKRKKKKKEAKMQTLRSSCIQTGT